jgi:hypothetical protein
MESLFILNESNIDLLFDYLNTNQYSRGPGCVDNETMRAVQKQSLNDKTGVHYLRLDTEQKTYVELTRWIEEDVYEFFNAINSLGLKNYKL